MNFLFDLHTHTLMSGHAYSTLSENIASAKANGLLAYGFSEHAPSMPGSVDEIYFANFQVIPKNIQGLEILAGVEANILDFDGTLDCSDRMYSSVHYIIASLHYPCIQPGTCEENTRAVLGAIRNPAVKVIGHPDDSRYPLDYDVVAQEAAAHHTALELNNSSLHPLSFRANGRENMTTLIKACMKHGTKMIVGSDAHYCDDVGKFPYVEALLEELQVPQEMILNTSLDGLEYVRIKK